MKQTTELDTFVQRVFPHLQQEDIAFAPLLQSVRKQTYPRKTALLNSGTPWTQLFYIQQGVVRMFYTDLRGRDSNKAFFGAGQCFWPVVPSDRQVANFNIEAIQPTTVLTCPFADLYAFFNSLGLWERFAMPYAEGLLEAKMQREHDFLLLSAEDRYNKFVKTFPHLLDAIPDYHMASFLGITNVSLSRLKKEIATRQSEDSLKSEKF